MSNPFGCDSCGSNTAQDPEERSSGNLGSTVQSSVSSKSIRHPRGCLPVRQFNVRDGAFAGVTKTSRNTACNPPQINPVIAAGSLSGLAACRTDRYRSLCQRGRDHCACLARGLLPPCKASRTRRSDGRAALRIGRPMKLSASRIRTISLGGGFTNSSMQPRP